MTDPNTRAGSAAHASVATASSGAVAGIGGTELPSGRPKAASTPSGGSAAHAVASVGVKIGGASGFWGDSAVAAPQLVQAGVDFIVFDYLAELTMSILAAARAKNPELGYATDFVQVTVKSILQDVVARNIRLVSNAGGVNPEACARAIEAVAAAQGLQVRVAVVLGDDVLPQADALCQLDGTPAADRPARLATANAYLGAQPIRAALDAGAQIVLTGRCVDSAVTLGVLMHAFNWSPQDLDRLAQASLAGHIIECGCQATGGLHTDWESVPDWPHMGYPIVECQPDGSFTVTKPAGTGGLVNPAVVAEQILYEIGDPSRYLLPDVVCDFTQVQLHQTGPDRVHVSGARGLPPTAHYKVSATYLDGFRCVAQLSIVGIDAVRKAQRTGEAILTRTREMFAAAGLEDYTRTHIEVLGSEAGPFGPQAQGLQARDVVLRVAVMHPQKVALELFAREVAPAGTSWSPGTTGGGGGRSSPSPSLKQRGFLIEKSRVLPVVRLGPQSWDVPVTPGPTGAVGGVSGTAVMGPVPARALASAPEAAGSVPLITLAWARSGDKGDISNIGVIARRPEWVDHLRTVLTPERVGAHLAHLVRGTVTRYEVPGLSAFNFVCTQALDGGGMASLRNDPLGKGMGQILLTLQVPAPAGGL